MARKKRERTPFGVFTSKLRAENNEIMRDMTEHLDCTVQYLSLVELGDRAVPAEWFYTLQGAYKLTESQLAELGKLRWTSHVSFDRRKRERKNHVKTI